MHTAQGFFDWGLKLPDKGVSRRIIRNLDINGRVAMAELQGPGCVRRFQVTGQNIGRELVLRIYFDGREEPNVEAPLADFFGIMHNRSELCQSPRRRGHPERASYQLNTPFLVSNPHNAFTTHFPMPFAESARFEVINDSGQHSHLFYYIDWHEYSGQELSEPLRFCARWRREAPVRDYQDDFLMLDADGPGRLIGYVHSIDMLHSRETMRWSHAGSDNIYIDGAGQHPSYIRGHGAEDTFGASFGGHTYPAQSFLFADMPFYEQKNDHDTDLQKLVGYRFFANEAIYFSDSLHLRFGARAHDLAATVYWYSASPVRPFTVMPPYDDRLPERRPRRRYDIALPDTGQWWICGPFPLPLGRQLPTDGDFDPGCPIDGRTWRRYSAKRGFVDFNHVFRPLPSNGNTVTLTAAAVAYCEITAPRACRAAIRLGWDDELTIRVNDADAQYLGKHDYFRSWEIEVALKRGSNTLAVALTNTDGLSRGAWCFSCGISIQQGELLVPTVKTIVPTSKDRRLLALAFAAGAAEVHEGRLPFIPPYSADHTGIALGDRVDLLCSPQTQVFPTACGPIEVTVAASDNTTLGFRRRKPVEQGPLQDRSDTLRGEVRANAHREDEPVTLELTIGGLPAGEYTLRSVHHCLADEERLEPMCIAVNGEPVGEDAFAQSAGCDPESVAEHTLCIRAPAGEPVRIAYEAACSAVVLNGLEITRRQPDDTSYNELLGQSPRTQDRCR